MSRKVRPNAPLTVEGRARMARCVVDGAGGRMRLLKVIPRLCADPQASGLYVQYQTSVLVEPSR